MSFLTWYAPNHLRQENRNWSIGCGLLRQWAYQNFLIVSKHIATGSARFWTLWMYPGQTASSKAATTKRKSWNVYASACVISIISEDVSCFATHKSSAESTPGTAWDDFLFLYPNYWRRTSKSCKAKRKSTENECFQCFSWWRQQNSNLWPSACEADALPAELCLHSAKNV